MACLKMLPGESLFCLKGHDIMAYPCKDCWNKVMWCLAIMHHTMLQTSHKHPIAPVSTVVEGWSFGVSHVINKALTPMMGWCREGSCLLPYDSWGVYLFMVYVCSFVRVRTVNISINQWQPTCMLPGELSHFIAWKWVKGHLWAAETLLHPLIG